MIDQRAKPKLQQEMGVGPFALDGANGRLALKPMADQVGGLAKF